MSRLILVRHGQTVWHRENRYAGHTDIALTEKGVAQGADLARWAAGAGLSAVWSSPLLRARLTAEPAARAAGRSVQIEPRLIEVDFGRAEGMTAQEMELAFGAERALFLEDPVAHPLPGSEHATVAASRGSEALRSIAAIEPASGRALVVAHNTLLRLVLCDLLGIPLRRYRQVFPVLLNAAGTEIAISSKEVALLSLNTPLRDL